MATLERERHPGRWLAGAAAAAACGFLMKGPLALAIPALVVVPILLIERRSFGLRIVDVGAAALIFLSIAMPWYVLMWMAHGTPYLESFFVGDNFERFATSRFNDPRPWWFYVPVAAGGLLPWTPLAVVWFAPIAQFLRRRRDVSTVDLRLLLWTVLPLVFFTLSIGKQPRYILPVLPPLAVLLAGSIVERTRDWRSLDGTRVRPRPNRSVRLGSIGSGVLLIGIAALLYRAQPIFLDVPPTTTIAAAAVIALGGAIVVLIAATSAWRAAPAALAVAAAIAFAILPYGALASSHDATVRRLATMVRNARQNDEAIGTYKVFVRNLVFYTGLKQTDLIHDAHVIDWLSTTPRTLLIMRTADAARLESEHGVRFEKLAALPYFDEGGLRVRTLLWPDPARDIEEVVLVRVALNWAARSRHPVRGAVLTPRSRGVEGQPVSGSATIGEAQAHFAGATLAGSASAGASHCLPGFRMPCGSKAALTRAISAIVSGESSSPRYFAFAKPMPCSPLIEPFEPDHPFEQLALRRSARAISAASAGSTIRLTWMLPSPA